MIITPDQLETLAKLGRVYVLSEMEKNIINWIGQLPTEEEISFAFCNLEEISEWGQVDTEEHTLEEYEAMLLAAS